MICWAISHAAVTSSCGSPASSAAVIRARCRRAEPVGAAAQQPAGAEQRVTGEAAVPQGVLLDPAPDLIDAGQR